MNVSREAPRLHGHINESRDVRSRMRMKDESSSFSWFFFPLIFIQTDRAALYGFILFFPCLN